MEAVRAGQGGAAQRLGAQLGLQNVHHVLQLSAEVGNFPVEVTDLEREKGDRL